MILKAIFCAQHFCRFGALLFIVNMLIKTYSTIICVPCMLEHEPLSLTPDRPGFSESGKAGGRSLPPCNFPI